MAVGQIFGGLSLVGTILGLGTGIAGSIVNDKLSLEELKRNKNNLTASYNLGTAQAQESYNLSKRQQTQSYNLGLNQAIANRNLALSQTAGNMEVRNQINNIEMATLQTQARQAEGSAINQAAQSGLRGTGSVFNAYEQTRKNADTAMKSKRLEINLQNIQNYQSALNNYINSSQNIDQYKMNFRQAMESLDTQYRQQTEAMKLNYDQQMQDIDEGINYMKSPKYRALRALGVTSDIFGSFGKVYESGIQADLWDRIGEGK